LPIEVRNFWVLVQTSELYIASAWQNFPTGNFASMELMHQLGAKIPNEPTKLHSETLPIALSVSANDVQLNRDNSGNSY
jgi:hypothetical protein